ncbi:hypothetical protein [Chelatococcus asaccharovorans]|uniref:Uncharacterized protein n=1 Tax=Chelatococcus asaccharovorans TaxID=28210 RepID=A0A2V3UE75_9HYPH|nr:hypothetical protein [Chelatococcus asaccharovorans]MBS7702675.1 hypothetical protein [Chelatococcus asaccharovorans]PXW56970.1 hypothetical protein C7450_1077 [Chelatococcus asaccharovorans]
MHDHDQPDTTGLPVGAIDIAALARLPKPADAAAERRRAIAIHDVGAQARRLGIAVDVTSALELGVDPRGLRLAVLDAAAARSDATAVVAAQPEAPAVAAGPARPKRSALVEMARRSADAGNSGR